MAEYSIKDLETLSGVKAHTIRIWEQRYNLLNPKRTETNIRYYLDEDLRRILNVSLLNKNGFKISKIAEMHEKEIMQAALKIANEGEEPNLLLDSLMHAMLDFDESRFEKVLNTAIMKMGFEDAFVNLMLVFLQRIGVLWTTGAVNPSQEHFISNLIRRKLCVAIDNRYVELNEKSKRFLLFLPEGETHEILLLFSEYLLRKNNHHVVYLGSSIPFEDINFVKEQFRPDCLLSFITVPMSDSSVFQYVQKLAKLFSTTKIYIGGAQLDLVRPDMPANFTHIKSLEDLKAII